MSFLLNGQLKEYKIWRDYFGNKYIYFYIENI